MKKKLFLVLCVSILVVILIELSGYSAFYIILGKLYSKKEIKKELGTISGQLSETTELKSDAGEIVWGDQVEVLNPYLGFTQDPKKNIGVSSDGFPSYVADQYIKRSPDKLIIALMGGSFAREIYFLEVDHILKSFSDLRKEVVLLNFSVGGYKQPQQLIALNYMLLKGAQFDIVINIDGFNEVALPPVENMKYGVSPFYPRMWLNRVKNQYSPGEIRLIGKIEAIKSLRRSCASFFVGNKLYRSPTLSLIWKVVDRRMEAGITSANIAMRSFMNHAESFAATGPDYKSDGSEDVYSDLADVWFRSSVLMSEICSANGIEYYHVLQPNQYVPESKKLSYSELKTAFDPDHPYREPVLNGYPKLRRKSEDLLKTGLNFLDMTDVFENNDETLYKDTCCHLNQAGYSIIVDKIVEFVKSRTAFRPH